MQSRSFLLGSVRNQVLPLQDMGIQTRYLRYRDSRMHIRLMNSLVGMSCKSSCSRQKTYLSSVSKEANKHGLRITSKRILLIQPVVLQTNLCVHTPPSEMGVARIEVCSGNNTHQQNIVSSGCLENLVAANPEIDEPSLSEIKQEMEQRQHAVHTKIEPGSKGPGEPGEGHMGQIGHSNPLLEDPYLERNIRDCVLLLHRMCTARPASHLAMMMRDFRAGLHRSNINSMFFTRYP